MNEKWWDKTRTWGQQGWIVTVNGKTIPCPVCFNYPVVYNGNYFCDDWGNCHWALAHPAVYRRDREICDLLGIGYH